MAGAVWWGGWCWSPVLLLFNQRAWLLKLAGLLLLLGTTYSVLVTFARMGTVAYSLALIMALLAATASAKSQHGLLFKRSMAAFVLLALVLAVALPIFTGSFAQTRLSQSQADFGVRLAHWSKALEMRDGGLGTELFGMGLGRYPETHYWRSPDPHAAAYRLGEEAGKPYLRLGTGSPLYMEQLVTVQAQQNYVLNLLVRGVESDTQINISLCEKWLLTSARCVFKTVEVKGGGQWQSVQITLASGAVGSGPWYAARPVKLSLFNAQAQAVVDVGQVSLQAANQMELLRNGNFSQGLDAWF